jgi:hypothetical protein
MWLAVVLLASCGSIPKTSVSELPEGGPLSYPNDSLYAHVLERAILTGGALNFDALRSDTELTAYLRELALVRTEVFTSRQQQLAFWINAHNAYVLDLLRSNQPIRNVDDLSGYKVSHVLLIAGRRYSLSEIEDHMLTHDFREPRAFFALSDGSRSAPPFRTEPYFESHLSDQLDEQVEEFLADSTKNYLDSKNNTLMLSEIFRRYSDEFDQWVGGTARFVREFAPDAIAVWIDRHPNVKISYLRYDEAINATPSEHHDEKPVAKPKRPRRKSSGGIE